SPARNTNMARAAQPQAKLPLDFSSYSFEEILEIKKDLDGEVHSRKAKEVEDFRSKLQENARALGISIEELVGVSGGGRRKRETKHPRGPQPAKYRGPNGEEWSGRGPSPRWMKPLLAKGKTKEDFLIR
ncbi:MAG: H-NS histone family protein, partial [Rhodomicrobium sp.]